jgi:hypothetical protein
MECQDQLPHEGFAHMHHGSWRVVSPTPSEAPFFVIERPNPNFIYSACAAAIVKAGFLVNYGVTGDVLWDSANLTIWIS